MPSALRPIAARNYLAARHRIQKAVTAVTSEADSDALSHWPRFAAAVPHLHHSSPLDREGMLSIRLPNHFRLLRVIIAATESSLGITSGFALLSEVFILPCSQRLRRVSSLRFRYESAVTNGYIFRKLVEFRSVFHKDQEKPEAGLCLNFVACWTFRNDSVTKSDQYERTPGNRELHFRSRLERQRKLSKLNHGTAWSVLRHALTPCKSDLVESHLLGFVVIWR
ncbi:unnamed protein product [Nezara viridula]|uniref:Uncharacterized protein n=1 Tax=Nezara viridula TaxID=85310 RepID=A0A9P0GZH3_NEZVI|nr:unnamed protein product [Nezara viridula]